MGNKGEPTVLDSRSHKSTSSIRRLLHVLKYATKNRQADTDSLKSKASDVPSVPSTPQSSSTDDKTESTRFNADEFRMCVLHSNVSSAVPPKSNPVTASESTHQTLSSVPENTASKNGPQEPSQASVAPSSTDTTIASKPSKSRKPRKPTMITPELMQQIQISNKKHSGGALRDNGELRRKNLGTATVTNRAKAVVASPLRWSEE
ncbi:hypothetical protein COCCADRAFT_106643 [Bipolaris zeicola 26-R-13]|uniref:Uncharacterized protein n=1 Tax=Cochliobolus carbonum (strain 26-R-13) TaxID=930089 RepID=W6XUH7_COCC2|nr:uncharacterized protein COCCADRAFT_106643 [Bipolaris zeicola 26-R-13]EUC29398.1 hypothetical protein COCCADRAFT_106643 [Bipolaris zeicola 26-R-13]